LVIGNVIFLQASDLAGLDDFFARRDGVIEKDQMIAE